MDYTEQIRPGTILGLPGKPPAVGDRVEIATE